MAKHVRVGKIPKGGELLGAYPGLGGDGWMFFHLPEKSNGGWMALKLVAMQPTLGGANFYLVWSLRDRRFVCGHEPRRLNALHPDVLDWSLGVMRDYRP